MFFSIPRKDIYAPRFLTTEPAEHQIAGWRMRKREATVLEVNQMEHMVTNRTKAIFESDLQISRRRQNGYHSTLDSHIDAARLLPSALDSGPVDVAFREEDDPVVDQLWLEVGPVINSMVVRMKALLNCFGVRAEEQSPFLRHFATPTELLDVYLTFVPRDHGGTDSSNDDNDEDTDSDGDGDSVTGDPGL